MPRPQRPPQPQDDSERLVALAKEALAGFQSDNPDVFKELATAFNGKSADLVLFGHGRFSVTVSDGQVDIQPNKLRGSGATGRGATTPETLMAILEGRLTPLEAFFKGDLVARADSADLHRAYDYFVRFSDAALRSSKLQVVLTRFREAFGQTERQPGKA